MSGISDLLSRRPTPEAIEEDLDRDPDVVSFDDEAADEVFATLSSTTARSILTALYDRPRTASGVAEEVDTSLQNVNYHLNNLRDASLVEVVETWYSDQGKEMKVYAPTSTALVLFAGDDFTRSSIFDAVKRFVGTVGILAFVSVLVDTVLRQGSRQAPAVVGVGGETGGPPTYPLPPGLVFFLGGLLAIVVVTALAYRRSG